MFNRARYIGNLSLGVLFAVSFGGIGAQEVARSLPYIGSVRGTDVKIRAGGSKNHLAFSSVRMGQRVLVERETGGWCRIYVPRWIPLYIHKDYVEVKGMAGIVKAGELNIRVAPQRQNADEVVGTLSRGSEVEIIGKEGDWLKIVAPPTAFAFVSKEYISREREVAPGEVRAQLALLKEAAVPVTAIAKKSKGSEKTVPAAMATEGRITTSALQKGEELFQEIRGRDPKDRDYSPVRALYQELIKSSEDRAEIAGAERALEFLGQQEERDKAILEANETVAEVERKNKEITDLARQRISGRASVDPDPYLARGWVNGMGRFSGQQGTHRLMKGSQVLFFLQSEEGNAVSLDSCLNKRVGVKGIVRELDPKFGANLIIVKEVVVLSDR